MASFSEVLCDIHTSNQATEWCSECEQALCCDCTEYHSQAKTSKYHKTIPSNNYAKLPLFVRKIRRTCENHDVKLDFYCPAHETLCCFYCIQSDHIKCTGVEPLWKVAQNVKFSTSIEELERNINDLKINIDKILTDRVQNVSNIDKQKQTVLKAIADTKKSIIKYLEKIERQAISELEETVKKEKSPMDKLLNNLRRTKSKLERTLIDMNKVKQFASDIEIFLAMLMVGKEIIREEAYLNSLQEDNCLFHTEILLENNQCCEAFQKIFPSLGKVVVNSKANAIQFVQQKTHGAQILVSENLSIDSDKVKGAPNDGCTREQFSDKIPRTLPETNIGDTYSKQKDTYDNFKVEFEKNLDISETKGQITACKVLPNGLFALLDHDNQCVIVSNYQKTVTRINLTTKPTDLTYIEDNKIAVTLYKENTVCIIDVDQGVELRRLATFGRCFGIDFNNGRLFVSLPHQKRIQILDHSEENNIDSLIKTSIGAFYLVYLEEKLYCSNNIRNVVFCISTSGCNLWELSNDMLQEPFCIAAESAGNLIVSCRMSNSVILISSDGTRYKSLLRSVKGIKSPRALDICSTSKTVILCDERSKSYLVYNMIYE